MTDDSITTTPTVRKRKPPAPCQAPGCERHAKTKGFCAMHYIRMKRHGDLEPIMDFGDPLTRFHKKYAVNPETGCWEWACYRHPEGYGIMAVGKKRKVRAHRFAYEHLVGPIPEGMYVLHRCDNRKCCCPGHLFLGTHDDNMADMARKGRASSGPGVNRRKLTDAMASNIRIMYARGATLNALNDIYGVGLECLAGVVKGRSYQGAGLRR